MTRLGGVLLASLLAAALQPGAVVAQQSGEGVATDDAEREARARQLFKEGVELAEQERFGDAADRFRRAHELRAAPAIAFNWAAALDEEGELVRASELLREVLDDPETKDELRGLAEERLDDVQTRLGSLTVQVSGATEGVRVTLDERELPAAVLGSPTPANPGPHEVAAHRDDEVVVSEQVEVPEGGEASVRLEVPVPAPAPDPLDVEPPEEPSGDAITSEWWFWTAIGGAVVALVTVGVLLSVTGDEPSPVEGNGDPAVLRWP